MINDKSNVKRGETPSAKNYSEQEAKNGIRNGIQLNKRDLTKTYACVELAKLYTHDI